MKKFKKVIYYICLAAIFGVVLTVSAFARTDDKSPLRVYVSILPQAYFVERIGGSDVQVEVLVQPGQSPATFEPTPRQMAELSRADIYFRIGLPFETRLLGKIASICPDLNVVDTRKGIKLRPMTGQGDDHDRGAADPHFWLDPELAAVQAKNIAGGLSTLAPNKQKIFNENLQTLRTDLKQLDSTLAAILAPLHGRKLYVFHPAYGYLAGAYGLEQVAVEAGGKEPGARQIAELIDHARADNVRVIFVQPQFSTSTAKSIAEAIGGVVIPLDPLARDYITNLQTMAARIDSALGDKVQKTISN